MIDFHSHILPEIDDGARNLETALKLLQMEKEDGVHILAATPHFYADTMRMDEFLRNRSLSSARLMKRIAEVQEAAAAAGDSVPQYPRIFLGAEVTYFPGISRAESMELLRLGETGPLLIELPFDEWDDEVLEEIAYIRQQRKIPVMLAHLDRYVRIRPNKKMIKELLNMDLIIQVNGSAIVDHEKAPFKWFKRAQAHGTGCYVLGSDCHSIHRRPPNLRAARGELGVKFGPKLLEQIDETGEKILGDII